MRLYTLTGATAVHDPEFGHIAVAGDGSLDVPEPLGLRLLGFHVAGKPMWEDQIGRQNRLIAEELERRKDPAALLAAVNKLGGGWQVNAGQDVGLR